MMQNCCTEKQNQKIKPLWGYFMSMYQVIWLAEKTLTLTDKTPEPDC